MTPKLAGKSTAIDIFVILATNLEFINHRLNDVWSVMCKSGSGIGTGIGIPGNFRVYRIRRQLK